MHCDSVTMETQVATLKVTLYLEFCQARTHMNTTNVFFAGIVVNT